MWVYDLFTLEKTEKRVEHKTSVHDFPSEKTYRRVEIEALEKRSAQTKIKNKNTRTVVSYHYVSSLHHLKSLSETRKLANVRLENDKQC